MLSVFRNVNKSINLYFWHISKMVKRKSTKQNTGSGGIPPVHGFTEEEILSIQTDLVLWYNENKRDLPWRRNATNSDVNQRAYAVWVSEIMLQQTQVATVIDYYNKWMKKWPTLASLALATLEEVNEMWSGLGYYSRGRRLHEGAKKVVEAFQGEMPKDAECLLKELPGVGKYTAGAIASIAYNERTGLVDGNVIRVLCRLRMIGADSTSQRVTDTLWLLANMLVPEDSPGDFNQGLMELGATVCTPKNPNCQSCPIRQNCKAYAQVEQQKQLSENKLKSQQGRKIEPTVVDIECLMDDCHLCLPDTENYDTNLGVMNYPRKGKKKAAREERTSVCVLCRKCQTDDEYFIVQRPKTGLLAGMWEFPSQILESDTSDRVPYTDVLSKYGVNVGQAVRQVDAGEVVHIFSHIHQTYVIEGIAVNQSDVEEGNHPNTRWVTKQQFMEAAVSTAMKKVLKAFETKLTGNSGDSKKLTKLKPKEDKNQRSIAAFFKPKSS